MADLIESPSVSGGSYLHATQKIPTELLSEVFLHCIPADRDPEQSGFQRQVMLPSHVSQYWRNVAIGTPQLWCCILFEIHHKPGLELAKIWLSRAQGCRLSLVIGALFSGLGDPVPDTQPELDIVIAHCMQWQHVRIYMPSFAFTMLSAVRGHVPQLESLEISPAYNISPMPPIIDIFEIAPKIRDFSCTTGWLYMDDHFDYITVPWGQLSRYKGGSHTVHGCLRIMRKLTSLVEFSIEIGNTFGHTFIPVVAHLPHLTTWELLCHQNLSLLFDSLMLPALNDFTLTTSHKWGHRSFISLLSRSSCALTRLAISLHTCITPATMEILGYTPHLTELCITSVEGADRELVALLTLSISNTTVLGLVPKLKILTFDVLESAGEVFADVIHSRWEVQGGAFSAAMASSFNRIERVYLDSRVSNRFDGRTAARFEAFAAEGLVVTIQ